MSNAVNTEAVKLIDTSQTMSGLTPTNTSGFSALFAGYRQYSNGNFNNLGHDTYFWSSIVSGSYAGIMDLYYNQSDVHFSDGNKNDGFSVRCLKD